MPKQEYVFSGYKSMWLVTMFDLPVKTKKDRKIYATFRKSLLEQGFSMIQFSVYVRFCNSEEFAQKYRKAIRNILPEYGQVRKEARVVTKSQKYIRTTIPCQA